jgi:predicted dehydrogenase
MSDPAPDARELKAAAEVAIAAPPLAYRPPRPRAYRPAIALIGCGGIARNHLRAYRAAGHRVVALCDRKPTAAAALRDEFFPDAVVADAEEIFSRADIAVVDLALHPAPRLPLMRRALEAGKHVLSQKPFVTDLEEGRRLVELAASRGLRLAVNQNGRWAPYFSYLRQAVRQGLLGEIVSCDMHLAWDHSWIQGTGFEKIHHVVLYDFGIHWFDIVSCIFGDRAPERVHAEVWRVPGQQVAPPLGADARIGYAGGQATLAFRAATRFSPLESTVVIGTKGTFRSSGPVCANDRVSLTTAEGRAEIPLEGAWFDDGFAGAMGELLCAIEENREPENSARDNLRGLELCLAAMASADSGETVRPGG